ncbi:uncharacterized protein LOC120632572 [Pararge aegeria]|uniref:uncharacterized protein LOC120632572 n=1 Tax=Pararge aegeria TaxID=116150 RepID=UPI0019D11347|nr:uncharacterized protein LOC120632572 [Pararge aegeria]
MQKIYSLIIAMILDNINTSYMNYDYGESTKISSSTEDYQEFEPVTIYSSNLDKISAKNINCDDFSSYAVNCRADAALIYNSSRRSPPPPSKIYYWCKAIRHLTNCAIDWNTDCKDVTDSHFNEESIKGHIHVVNNVCDDEWLLIRYADSGVCIEATADSWESCYVFFKQAVEEQKNNTHEWTHYEVHFHLCCARARFRRCTLEALFESTSECTHKQAVMLQKYSVIVSEGDVYQDCDHNVMYTNCPGGDPRPSASLLTQLMSAGSKTVKWHSWHSLRIPLHMITTLFLLIYFRGYIAFHFDRIVIMIV